ncbi:hypothetical protein [Actinocrispum sp. NPDC049592]
MMVGRHDHLGSLPATEIGQLPTLDYDFIEWHREGVALLTNLTTRQTS